MASSAGFLAGRGKAAAKKAAKDYILDTATGELKKTKAWYPRERPGASKKQAAWRLQLEKEAVKRHQAARRPLHEFSAARFVGGEPGVNPIDLHAKSVDPRVYPTAGGINQRPLGVDPKHALVPTPTSDPVRPGWELATTTGSKDIEIYRVPDPRAGRRTGPLELYRGPRRHDLDPHRGVNPAHALVHVPGAAQALKAESRLRGIGRYGGLTALWGMGGYAVGRGTASMFGADEDQERFWGGVGALIGGGRFVQKHVLGRTLGFKPYSKTSIMRGGQEVANPLRHDRGFASAFRSVFRF